jgi:HTH-type transcriptional regulator/antitoxin HipB
MTTKHGDIGTVIRFHRKKSGLTQEQLARLAGVGKTAVFDIEKNKPSVQLDTLRKLLAVLNISLRLESPLMHELERSEIDPNEKS